MQTENKTCKECSKFDRCEMWNYSYDPCPEFKDKRKLIYADTVVEKISELILLDDHEKKMLECFVEKCVEVDAEEVVRCKDCVHYDGEGCLLTYGEFEPNSMDFCSYGERRNGG